MGGIAALLIGLFMISVYKAGGPYEKDGVKYSFMAISPKDIEFYQEKGWYRNFSDILIEEAQISPVKKPRRAKASE